MTVLKRFYSLMSQGIPGCPRVFLAKCALIFLTALRSTSLTVPECTWVVLGRYFRFFLDVPIYPWLYWLCHEGPLLGVPKRSRRHLLTNIWGHLGTSISQSSEMTDISWVLMAHVYICIYYACTWVWMTWLYFESCHDMFKMNPLIYICSVTQSLCSEPLVILY